MTPLFSGRKTVSNEAESDANRPSTVQNCSLVPSETCRRPRIIFPLQLGPSVSWVEFFHTTTDDLLSRTFDSGLLAG